MPDIASFIEELRGRGMVLELEEPLDRVYEASRLISRHDEGPTLLYRIRGSPLTCVSNLVNTREKLVLALGAGSIEEAYEKLLGAEEGRGKLVEEGFTLRRSGLTLSDMPALKFYRGDGGLYITSSIIVACLEDTCNASVHRMMVLDDRRAAVRMVPRHLHHMYVSTVRKGGELRAAVVIGVHPAVMLAASTSPPYGVFELELAASLMGGKLRTARTPLYGIPVPSEASLVLEGRFTGEEAEEGPFVDLTGTHDHRRLQPVFTVDEVYVAEEPYFHVILPGGGEHRILMGFPREAAIWRAVSRVVPRVHGVRLTRGGGGWLHAVVSITKSHEGDAKNAIMAAFSAHPSLKHVVVVDGDIDVDSPEQVEWAIATRFQADRDLVVVQGARLSTLDPSGREGLGAKMGLDATMPLDGGDKYRRAVIPGEEEDASHEA